MGRIGKFERALRRVKQPRGHVAIRRAQQRHAPQQIVQEHAVVDRGVLRERAVGVNQFAKLCFERGQTSPPPMRALGCARQNDRGGNQADALADTVIIFLAERVVEIRRDAPARCVDERAIFLHARGGRRFCIGKCVARESRGEKSKRYFLAAHPVCTAVRRVLREPIFCERPKSLRVAFVAFEGEGARE